MDAPRRTISIGPVTISIRRGERDDVARVGPVASPLVHLVVLVLAILLTSTHKQKQREEEIPRAKTPPVTVTFVSPFKPPPPPPPKAAPREQTFQIKKPPPPTTKKLLMQPAPDTIAAAKAPKKSSARDDAGRSDTRPAGGEAGGPLPKPLDGAPDPGSLGRDTEGDRAAAVGSSADDLEARLRSFKRAIEEPRPPNPKGNKGGGAGRGGLTMPNMPETGFGVGNLEFEGRDYDWADYGRQIYWAILQAWYRRLLSDAGVFERWASETRILELDHKSGVHFTILRSGQVVDIGVESASGCRPLDDSATEALQEVVLPPLPEDFKRESEIVHARFIAEGPIQGMRQTLQQLHDAGWF